MWQAMLKRNRTLTFVFGQAHDAFFEFYLKRNVRVMSEMPSAYEVFQRWMTAVKKDNLDERTLNMRLWIKEQQLRVGEGLHI